MRFLLTLSLAAMLVFLPGCSEKPADDQGAGSTAVTPDQNACVIDFQPRDLAVGQWISYGVDQNPAEVTFSVVAREAVAGTDCFWIQIEAGGNALQILIDPVLLGEAMDKASEAANEFLADPAAYVQTNVPGTPQQFLTTEDNLQNFMTFVSAVKMVKMSENGTIMAYDLTNVPATLQPVLQDPDFLARLQAGFTVNMQGADAAGMTDSLARKLSEYEFDAENTTMNIAGATLEGSSFTITGTDRNAEVFFSSELPIFPLAFATATDSTGATHSISVRGYGDEGAENLVPGAPAQTVDIAPMIQMLITQMQSQMQQAPARGAGGQ